MTVAGKSSDEVRRDAAQALLRQLSMLFPALVNQGALVSHELVRVAVLLHEMWAEVRSSVMLTSLQRLSIATLRFHYLSSLFDYCSILQHNFILRDADLFATQ